MADKVRLAPVGLGRWARVLARGAQRGDVIELASCFTRDETRRREFMEEFGIERQASSLEELLADDSIEGIVATTPNDTHRDIIVQCLEAGKPVYTDKPIAASLEDAVAIAQAAESTRGTVAVGHSARRLAGSRVMRERVEDGTVGGVLMAEANFSNERGLELTPDTWRWYWDKAPGGPLTQLGVHHADNLQYLLGPVTHVSTHMTKVFTNAEVPDAVMAILWFESGALGYLGTGWASPGVYTINLQGTKQNLRFDVDFSKWAEGHKVDQHSTLLSQDMGQTDRTTLPLHQTDMYREQLEEFALAARGGATVEVGVRESTRALAVIVAGILSAQNGGEKVSIDEVLKGAGADDLDL